MTDLANTGLEFLKDNRKIVEQLQDQLKNLGSGDNKKILDSGLKFVRERFIGNEK